ncbi:MAG: hypothetical protein JWL90_2847 [Chthoniobacteraceae bacterium]|nr:hypothetical protein [Chthoniobacteraceae bacterium]
MFTPPICRFAAFIFLFTTLCAGSLRANPVISEIMADNVTAIADEDGAYSDWIEIYNPGTTAVNLLNWCLTDNSTNLTKWRFPDVTLGAGQFMVVWASGKNRRIPGKPLHTNFSLDNKGEYVALVRADGLTIEQQFSPAFPSLEPDESYGLNFTGTPLILQGATARYMVPSSDALGLAWTTTAFNDGAWTSGLTGIGFGLTTPGFTVRQVAAAAAFGGVNSVATADALLALPKGDARIASETTAIVAQLNLLGDGGDGHYASNLNFPNGSAEPFAIKATGSITIPTAGTYVFGLNSDDGGRIKIDGAAVMIDDTNHGASDHLSGAINLTAGVHSVEVIMWEGGGGDEVEFFAAPGALTAWNATNFKLVGAVGALAVATPPLSAGATGGAIGTNVDSAMRNVNATCYVRVPFTASNVTAFTSLTLKMRYNDGFVAYLNGTKIVSRNAPASPVYNSTATASQTDAASLAAETIDITPFLNLLVNGNNVLAVHGMNNTAANVSFLVLPELLGGGLFGGDPVFFTAGPAGRTATPGAANGAPTVYGKVEDTQFSVNRGFFTAPFSLVITSATPGAEIRYTLDSSTPTATSGLIYTGPLNISSTTIVRAAAFKPGYQPTDLDTQSYFFLSDIINQSPTGLPPGPNWQSATVNGQVFDYGMDPDIVNNTNPEIGGVTTIKNALSAIPSVSIVTDLPNLFSASGGIYVNPGGRGFQWERPCSIELIGDKNSASGGFQANAGVRIRGGFSRSGDNPKHGFHIYFRSDYGESKLKYPLFGREGADTFDQIDLRTAENYSWSFGGDGSNTFLREETSRELQGAMGNPTSHCRYYHLYINGHYWGLYDSDERTEASFGETYFGGDKADYDVIKAEQDSGYTTGATDGNLNAWQDLWNKGRAHAASPTNANYFKMMGKAADGVTPTADPVLLDVDNLIDYMLLTFWTGNLDGCTSNFLGNDKANNWFGMRNRLGNQGFRFFAHDFEHTYFSVAEDRTGPFVVANLSNFAYSNAMFLHQDLSANSEYRIRWADHIQRHMFHSGVLAPASLIARIGVRAATVDSVIAAESARWGDAKRAAPFTRLDWKTARDYLLNSYVPVRGSSVLSQLRADGLFPSFNAPTLNQFGGYIANGAEVRMTGYGGTIYYTLDGSDPRLLGGGLNPAAQVYTSATTNDVMIPLNGVWKFLGDGSNQGTAWRASGFNDFAWPSGPGEFGYGDGDEATVTPYVDTDSVAAGVQKNATTYFRRSFTATAIPTITALSLHLKYDDGVIVYINGVEAMRTGNMSSNPAYNQFTDNAAGTPDETAYYDFELNKALLVEGTNTIAAEVHQAANSSTDVSFSMSLTATKTQTATPLLLTGSGPKRLRVRALNGAEWSALDDALFLVDTIPASAANLVISELMYHPGNPSAAEMAAGFDNSDDFEYLELTNISTQSVDVDGLYFSAGIDFDFKNSLLGRVIPPGARWLLVANKAAFEKRYGTTLAVAGQYSGSLNNGGEKITLLNASSVALRTLNYSPLAPWPAEADGEGVSLVLRNPSSNPDPDISTNWRVSGASGGNPGTSDTLVYAAWKTLNAVTVDNADTDKDGLTNSMEYILGGSLTAQDSMRLPRIGTATFVLGGLPGIYTTFTFTRRLVADDVTYVVESTSDFVSWTIDAAVLASVRTNSDATETVVYRSVQPFDGGKQFLRLRATLAP